MKKVCIAFLFVTCLFAILFELTGTDPEHTFTFRSYIKYVTENIKPFPTVDFSGNFISDTTQVFTYFLRLILCIVDNLGVLLYGLFPVSWSNPSFSFTEEIVNDWDAMGERHRAFWQKILSFFGW